MQKNSRRIARSLSALLLVLALSVMNLPVMPVLADSAATEYIPTGFPMAGTTGPAAAGYSELTAAAPQNIPVATGSDPDWIVPNGENGYLIEGRSFTGGFQINRPNVTIRGCRIAGAVNIAATAVNCKIEYNEVYGVILNATGVEVSHCDISNAAQGINVKAPVQQATISGNYIHDLAPRMEGINIEGGASGLTINNNTIIAYKADTAQNGYRCLLMSNWPKDPISNTFISGNYLSGASLFIQYATTSTATSNLKIIDNTFSKFYPNAGQYGNYSGPALSENGNEYYGNSEYTPPAEPRAVLEVSDVTWSPISPLADDAVTFSVHLKNSGNIPSSGVITPVLTIDGIQSLSGVFNQSIAPGSTAEIVVDGTWTAAAGSHDLEATVTYGGETSASWTGQISIYGGTDESAVEVDYDLLTEALIKDGNDSLDFVFSDLNLVTGIPGGAGCTITWQSSDQSRISNTGIFTLNPNTPAKVTLTATITKGGVSATKTFVAAHGGSCDIVGYTMTPANPVVWDDVKFVVSVKNTGTVASPPNIQITATVLINNVGIAWSNVNRKTSIPAGATVDIELEAGPGWRPSSAGSYPVTIYLYAGSATVVRKGFGSIAIEGEDPGTPAYDPPDLPEGYIPLTIWPNAENTGLVGFTRDNLPLHLYGPNRSDTITYPSNGKEGTAYDPNPTTVNRLPYGLYVVSQNDTVIENTYIHGGLSITARNVVIRNCYIEASEGYDAGTNVNGTGVIKIQPGASATIINCEINGLEGVHAGIWHQGEGMVAVGNSIFNADDGIFHWASQGVNTTGNNFRIQDNWIHDLTKKTSNGHIDGWQTTGCRNGLIKNNYFDLPLDSSGNFAIYAGQADARYIMVEGNLFQGSGYTVYCYAQGSPGIVTSIWFVNNAFSEKYSDVCGVWGPWYNAEEPDDGWFNDPDTGKSYRQGNYYWPSMNPADPRPPQPVPEGAWLCTGDGKLAEGLHMLGEGNTGIVTTEFKITPLIEKANSGAGYISYGKEATAWGGLAAILKLNSTGFFDIYKNNTWPLENLSSNLPDDQLPMYAKRYEAGKTYLIRMVMDTGAQTYSAWVTDLDVNGNPVSDPFCIGENYPFRASTGGMTDVGRFYTGPGTNLSSYYVTDHEILDDSSVENPPAQAYAKVTKEKGKTNTLTITVIETLTSGENEITGTFAINNNADGFYVVGSYTVYVSTYGNVKIKDCYIVE